MADTLPKSAVLIAGPTASGKSGFAMKLAEAVNGVIVNADSMQVYDGLHILTARPSAEDEAATPHRLYGHVPSNMRYSVGAWLRDVEPVLHDIWESEQVPILVGGTGLYFKALTEGLAQLPEIPAAEQDAFMAENADISSYDLHARLFQQDSETASKLERTDRQRILRALMVVERTGQGLSTWQKDNQSKSILPLDRTAHRVLMPGDREWLYERIETRFHQMMEGGGAKEARDLVLGEPWLDVSLPIMGAISIPHYVQLLREQHYPVHEEVVGKSIRDTRRYAKRQLTWFRNQMGGWPRLDPQAWEANPRNMQQDLDALVQEVQNGA